MRTISALVLIFSALGCSTDGDGDHISDQEEATLGLNPAESDTDGDGLDDLMELYWTMTDPLSADSDADGEDDGSELRFGYDPLDAESQSPQDGWPVAPLAVKDAIPAPPPGARLKVGDVMPRFLFTGTDRFVDAYDFAGHGLPLLLGGGRQDAAGSANAWVPQELANNYVPSLAVRDLVASEGILFAALATNAYREEGAAPPSAPNGSAWCTDLPSKCLAEESLAAWAWTGQSENELWILLDDQMVVRAFTESVDGVTDFSTLEAVLFTLLDAP